TAAGTGLALIDLGYTIAPRLFGQPDAQPHLSTLSVLLGVRTQGLALLNALNAGVQQALITVLEFSLFREFIRRLTRNLSPNASERLAFSIAVMAITVFSILDTNASARVLTAFYESVTITITLFVILRIGLLASVAMYFVALLLERMPLTLNG